MTNPFFLSQTENKIVYGHTLHVGTGAGQYSAGGLVTHLAFGGNLVSVFIRRSCSFMFMRCFTGGSETQGRLFDHYAAKQNSSLFG